MNRLALLSLAALAALTILPAAQADAPASGSGLKVVAHIPGPDGGWDYASFDPAHRRVYVAHSTVVLALDADTGKLNASFAAGSGLHAVLPIPGRDEILTTNSKVNTAMIF